MHTCLQRVLSGKLEEAFESVFIRDLGSGEAAIVSTQQTGLSLRPAFDLEGKRGKSFRINVLAAKR